jgi:hypothetical protein
MNAEMLAQIQQMLTMADDGLRSETRYPLGRKVQPWPIFT